jgi:outer membrane protein OmpA-like peptidoglycan-associated protein
MGRNPLKRISFICLAAFVALAVTKAQAADIVGSKDYPLIKRYEGSEIIGYKTIHFDDYTFALSAGTNSSGTPFKKSQTVSGAITRIIYRVPAGHTNAEIFANYKQALAEAKFQILYEQPADAFQSYGDGMYGPFASKLYSQNEYPPSTSIGLYGGKTVGRYLVAENPGVDGKDIYVTLLLNKRAEGLNYQDVNFTGSKKIAISKDEIIAGLDVIEVKALENKMVFVKSSEMADAINKTGKIDIYGITFDIDKTDIKPESVPTLTEVAKLLTENPTFKLEISGHTDSTGSAPHNQTLSEGRAVSVVNTLVSQYHIDASRLVAKGYGDTKPIADNATEEGRAKNRRVELSKLQ